MYNKEMIIDDDGDGGNGLRPMTNGRELVSRSKTTENLLSEQPSAAHSFVQHYLCWRYVELSERPSTV